MAKKAQSKAPPSLASEFERLLKDFPRFTIEADSTTAAKLVARELTWRVQSFRGMLAAADLELEAFRGAPGSVLAERRHAAGRLRGARLIVAAAQAKLEELEEGMEC